MTFTSTIFLIGLLPWFVILYRWLGQRTAGVRKALILLANALFLVWSGVGGFLLLCAYCVLVYLLSLWVRRVPKKAALAVSTVLAVLPLAVTKYTLFLVRTVNALAGWSLAPPSVIVPVGISFVTFEAVSLLVDVYRKKLDRTGFVTTCLYLTFFPTVTSGPIIRYGEFEKGLCAPERACDYTAAIERIVIGLGKKVLIADKLAVLADYYYAGIAAGGQYSCPGLWIGSIAYSLQLYFDFSGYSDMAVGIGQLLGFSLRENFRKPYRAGSISDFWNRWHISLTQWFREYIYFPLGGNRCSVPRHIFNMLTVWLVTGIWHGADWAFLVWGLGYFVLLTAEKYLPALRKVLSGVPGHIYTLFFVNLLWVPFRAGSLSTAADYLRGMFGGGSGILEEKAVRFLPLILLAVLACLPWDRFLSRFTDRKWFRVLRGLLLIALAALAVCAAVNSSYAPYIYGNF